ncbi:MAG: hypothetical protein KME16_24180 [Scytolyngbya sp. HA4215-MV1]|jgi:hypothetical protein|nr:hypothetical protein [Scytolyngbya sp. HA4215-MV1]
MTNPQASSDTYDREIVPAETAARKEREGEGYKQIPENTDPDSVDTTGGYTVDKEGLVDNFAVEPEMYYEVPGDARAQKEAEVAQRQQELQEINQTDETGKLTAEEDNRGKGTGLI